MTQKSRQARACTQLHFNKPTQQVEFWVVDELKVSRDDNICALISIKCHQKSYNIEIKYHVRLITKSLGHGIKSKGYYPYFGVHPFTFPSNYFATLQNQRQKKSDRSLIILCANMSRCHYPFNILRHQCFINEIVLSYHHVCSLVSLILQFLTSLK